MATITVSNASQLNNALASASAGDVIELNAGDYGNGDFNNLNYSGYVTIRSADANNPATFEEIDIVGSSFIAIENVHVDNDSNGGAASKIVNIDGQSHDIRFRSSEVNGSVNNSNNFVDYDGHYGIFTGNDVRNVAIEDNFIHDVKNAIVGLGSDDLTVIGNRMDDLGNDGMKFAGIDGIVIENNYGASRVVGAPDAHLDFIQFQGRSQNIEIRGNVYLAGTSANVQGIFLDDAAYTNVLIEQNIIYTGMTNGIVVSEGSGIVIRENTVLNTSDSGAKATVIRAPSGQTVIDNIISNTKGEVQGSNIRVQHTNPGADLHYSDLFVNAEADLGITIQDLRPVPGSLAETTGAFARIAELLGEEVPGRLAPDPVPELQPDPEPTPDAQPDPTPSTSSANDFVTGGENADVMLGYAGEDTLKGRGGDDNLKGQAGDDVLKGQAGDDRLKGGNGEDKLKGGTGSDTLKGSSGDDRIFGNAGDDLLVGQKGNDTFVFKRNDGDDQIRGFKSGEDMIHIRKGADRFSDLDIRDVADGVEISFTGTTILLINRTSDDIDASDFMF